MTLDQQIQALIDNAPQDGSMPDYIRDIGPVLKFVAGQLKHSQYYIIQTIDGAWMTLTLTNQVDLTHSIQVIYAYPTLQDATNHYASFPQDPQMMALPIPVTHLLFQTVALKTQIDSILFVEKPGDLNAIADVRCADLNRAIEAQLQQTFSTEIA
jgi:hypothetical protein